MWSGLLVDPQVHPSIGSMILYIYFKSNLFADLEANEDYINSLGCIQAYFFQFYIGARDLWRLALLEPNVEQS